MRKNFLAVLILAVLVVLALVMFGAASAQAQVDVAPGVARVSLIHGDVSTQRGDSGDWSVAALNAPIVSGDKISTAERSRTEVQLDYSNVLRLDGRTQAAIASLSRTQIQVQLSRGLADFVVFKDSEADLEIDTPNVAVRPSLREGIYRIEVNSEGETLVIVRKGEAEISTPQGSTRVQKGEMATVRGSGGDTLYKVADAPSKDAWDSWNNERNDAVRNAKSWGYTNRYYTGAEDLDAYGRWVSVPDYGSVWVPVVGAGWAPYRLGRWVWEPYWGWTWVSYEPWGWAPYHYGRWFLWGGSWAWWPGPIHRAYRPIWAPAYVSFFGFGGGISVGVGFGSFGWLPIGPCDRFFPWYGSYRTRFNTVNIVNIYNYRDGHGYNGWGALHGGNRYSNLRLVDRDDRIRGAMSTVPAGHFGTGTVAARAADRDMFHDAHVMTGNLPVVPTRATLSPSNRPGNGPGAGGEREHFFTRTRPPAAPEAFDRQAAQVQDAIQRSGRFTPVRAGGRQGPEGGPRGENPRATDRVPDSLHRPIGNSTAPRAAENAPERNGAVEHRPSRPERNGAVEPKPSGPERNTDAGRGNDRDWRQFGDVAQRQNQNQDQNRNQEQGTAPNRTQRDQSPQRVPPARGNSEQPVTQERTEPQQRQERPATEKGGWRRFSDRDNSRPGATGDRPATVPPPAADHTPSPRQPERNAGSTPAETPRGGSEWRRFPPESQQQQRPSQGARQERAPERNDRPPLDLRQPIVRPRAERSAPAGGGSRPSAGGGSRPSGGRGGQSGGRSEGGRSGSPRSSSPPKH